MIFEMMYPKDVKKREKEETKMYGAILGDIIGSRFEFDRGGKTKDFELFTRQCNWTYDSVMTIAIMEALMNAGKNADVDAIHEECIKSMKKWGKRYPNAGYGVRFYGWVLSDNPEPIGSFGNGSAMRVSAAGWIYDTVERTREVAKATAEVTHNHPEGIKGAECTAAVMFLARTGKSKEEIKEYVIREFGYDVSKTVDELRPLHEHVEWCQDSLPKALASSFEGDSYEDVVRNAVSLGGDTDTLAAIAGAMGDAMYGVPLHIIADGMEMMESDMIETVRAFINFVDGKVSFTDWNKIAYVTIDSRKFEKMCNHFIEGQSLEEYRAYIYRYLMESTWKYSPERAAEIIVDESDYVLQCYNERESVSSCAVEIGFGCG